MIRFTVCIAAFFALMNAAEVRADAISLSAVADTTLNQHSPNNNMGAYNQVLAGKSKVPDARRGLFRFDVPGSIPAGSLINSATLTLSVANAPSNSSTFDLFRSLVNWNEGIGTTNQGLPAVNGETTWNNRFHSATTPTPWGAPGGLAGTDYATSASSSLAITTAGNYSWGGAGLASDVQHWLDNPASNYGWFLISKSENISGTACQISSREAAAGLTPSLVIGFTPVPEPSTTVLLAAGIAAGIIALVWQGLFRWTGETGQ